MSQKALNEKIGSVERYEELAQILLKKKNDATLLGEEIRKLKMNPDSSDPKSFPLKDKIEELRTLKIDIDKITKEWRRSDPDKLELNVEEFLQFLARRFFVVKSFEIYDCVAGLYDFGPPACAIKSNLLNFWRNHFVLEENMLEVDCSVLTPSKVFEVSGHVARFTDFIVKDVKTSEAHRADKLVAQVLEKRLEDAKTTQEDQVRYEKILNLLDGYTQEDLENVIKNEKILSPEGNQLTSPTPFNLMFQTSIGPTGKAVGFMRPETAQGIFVNFKRLLDYNGGQMPFAGACVGQVFRNEISPRGGLLRVREFTVAEIEHFMHPEDKSVHPKFDQVKHIKVPMLSREDQNEGKRAKFISIEDAFNLGMLKNYTLAYFLGRIYQFMMGIGILSSGIRFRQHLQCEMAHYASDCWDCELLSSSGWIECVGIADRSAYDLTAHTNGSKTELVARETYNQPKQVEVVTAEANKKVFGPLFKKDASSILQYIEGLSDEEKLSLGDLIEKNGEAQVEVEGKTYTLPSNAIKISKTIETITGKNFVPSVIEPSFGIGRIIYCLMEQTYWIREGEEDSSDNQKLARSVLSLPPAIAPYKCVVLPVANSPEFTPFIEQVTSLLRKSNISHRSDTTSVAVGRRYARADDLGIPFAITIDTENTISNNAVTIRERDSCEQIIVPICELVSVLTQLCEQRAQWSEIKSSYSEQRQTASEKVGKKN